jgi:hypothetical protein
MCGARTDPVHRCFDNSEWLNYRYLPSRHGSRVRELANGQVPLHRTRQGQMPPTLVQIQSRLFHETFLGNLDRENPNG